MRSSGVAFKPLREEIENCLDIVRWFNPLRATRRVPDAEARANAGGFIDGQSVIGVEIEFVSTVILPDEDLKFIGGAALFDQCALLFNNIGKDAYVRPVFLDQLSQLCELDEGRNGG